MSDIENIISCDSKKLVIKYLYEIEGYCTFNIYAKSNDFAGSSNFCMDRDSLVRNVQFLNEMNKNLYGQCRLLDVDSDSYMNFEMEHFGHLQVYGQIGGTHEDHYVKFKIATDQTILQRLIKVLEEAL